MNDLSTPFRRPIDLVSEPPFRLGAATVDPASLEVRWPDGACALEPRVMQVLVALNRRRGGALSRDELSHLCWEGRIVGEDALVRCIVKLRKVFQRDPAVEIRSIPKVGYRLRVEDVCDETRPAPPAADEAKIEATAVGRFPRPRLAAAIAAGVVVAAGAGAMLLPIRPAVFAAESVRSLTSEAGVETHPALSPDGRLLVYAAGGGFGAPRDIYLRGVADGTPVRLTETPQDELAPTWSRDGRQIAFVRRDGEAPCEILVAPAPQGQARVVGRCAVESTTRLAWTASGELLLSDRPTPDAVRRIRALDPATGRVRDVSAPPPASLGDSDPVVSHRGDRIVFRRTFSHGVDDLYTVAPSGGGERALTEDGWKAVGYAFSADGRTVLFSSNRGGDFGLWSVDVQRPAAPARVSLGLLSFGRLSTDEHGLLAAEAGDYRSNLFAWRAGREPTALTDASGSDWDPDLAPSGALSFVSDQGGGGSEIWVRRGAAAPMRLTDIKASYAFSPRWSPDGTRIAFVAARNHRTDVYLINPDGSGLRKATTDGAARGEIAWDASGAILAPTLRAGGWRVERIDAQGRVTTLPGTAGVRSLKSAGPAGVFALRRDDDRIWRLGATGAVLSSPVLRVDPDAAWAPTTGGIYQLMEGETGETVLRLTEWSGEARTVQSLGAFGLKHSLATSYAGDSIVAGRVMRDEADVALIRLTRR